MKKLLTYFIFLIYGFTFSQVFGDEEYASSYFDNWNPDSINDYQGYYSFGFSEIESQLKIFISDTIICAQLQKYEWINESPGHGWMTTYENFTNVKIIGNEFYSDQTKGTFATFKTENRNLVGLIVTNPWGNWIDSPKGEFGDKSPSLNTYLQGEYPECSEKLLSYDSIKDLDLKKLKIMRNEIFARYNYKFKVEGEMYKYFSNKDWYLPFYNNVEMFLTRIETNNIQVIKQVEKTKNGL